MKELTESDWEVLRGIAQDLQYSGWFDSATDEEVELIKKIAE